MFNLSLDCISVICVFTVFTAAIYVCDGDLVHLIHLFTLRYITNCLLCCKVGAFVISPFSVHQCTIFLNCFLKTTSVCKCMCVLLYSTLTRINLFFLSAPTAELAPRPVGHPASPSAPAAAAGPAPGCDWFRLPEKTKWHDTLQWIGSTPWETSSCALVSSCSVNNQL